MVYQSFLIKYAEIGTKGKNRYLFEDALIKQIKNALQQSRGKISGIQGGWPGFMFRQREIMTMMRSLKLCSMCSALPGSVRCFRLKIRILSILSRS